MDFRDYEYECGHNNAIYALIEKHQECAKENIETVLAYLELADENEFSESDILMHGYFDSAILHANSARYLLKFMHLIDAISEGYAVSIKCPVCKSREVDLEIEKDVIKHSCVTCDHEWEYPLR